MWWAAAATTYRSLIDVDPDRLRQPANSALQTIEHTYNNMQQKYVPETLAFNITGVNLSFQYCS